MGSDKRINKYAILIRRPYWRRGYASEAIKLVARYYFRELGYQKLAALVYSFNERSLRMHEKLGFVFEGRLRRTILTQGRHYDTICFGMTKEEFDLLDMASTPPLLGKRRWSALPCTGAGRRPVSLYTILRPNRGLILFCVLWRCSVA